MQSAANRHARWRAKNADYFRDYAAAHPEQMRESARRYAASPLGQYTAQARRARLRGIEWHLSLDEWLAWWGPDLALRGRGYGRMCMARYGDTGPYAVWNIYKATGKQNFSDYWARTRSQQKEDN